MTLNDCLLNDIHLSGFGALYGLWRGMQWWIAARQKQQQEVYHYVERIIEFLSSQIQSSGESAYVPVIHVRDQLIPPQNRESKFILFEVVIIYDTLVNLVTCYLI